MKCTYRMIYFVCKSGTKTGSDDESQSQPDIAKSRYTRRETVYTGKEV